MWAYDEASPSTFWQIGDHTRLYEPAEAERLKLRIKGKSQPPQPPAGDSRPTAVKVLDEPPADLLETILGDGRPGHIKGSGLPAQAFQQIWDQCEEQRVTALRRLQLDFYGFSKSQADSLAAVGLAIPQIGKADFGIMLKLTVQFDPPPGEQFILDFQGKWDRYKRFKQVTDAFAREEVHRLLVEFKLIVDFGRDVPLNDMQLKTIQDVLTQMGMGPVTVVAEPIDTVS